MIRPNRAIERSLLFLLFPLLVGACEESTLPVIPEGSPRFTGVAADVASSTPRAGSSIQPGEREFTFTVYFQIASDWASEDLDMWFLIRSWSNDEFVGFVYTDILPIDVRTGTMRFQGTMVVPNCGAIDEIDLVGRIYERDTDFSSYVQQDGYVVDVVNTSSVACPT